MTDSSNFPTTPGAFQPTRNGPGDAFVVKIIDDPSPIRIVLPCRPALP